jgi:hypothetical protein
MTEPRNADSLTHVEGIDTVSKHVDTADDLMPWDDRHGGPGQFAIDDMQIRAADPARCDLNTNLPWSRHTVGEFLPDQITADCGEYHGVHVMLRRLSRHPSAHPPYLFIITI